MSFPFSLSLSKTQALSDDKLATLKKNKEKDVLCLFFFILHSAVVVHSCTGKGKNKR